MVLLLPIPGMHTDPEFCLQRPRIALQQLVPPHLSLQLVQQATAIWDGEEDTPLMERPCCCHGHGFVRQHVFCLATGWHLQELWSRPEVVLDDGPQLPSSAAGVAKSQRLACGGTHSTPAKGQYMKPLLEVARHAALPLDFCLKYTL